MSAVRPGQSASPEKSGRRSLYSCSALNSGRSVLLEKTREEINDRRDDPTRTFFLFLQLIKFLIGEGSGVLLVWLFFVLFRCHADHSFLLADRLPVKTVRHVMLGAGEAGALPAHRSFIEAISLHRGLCGQSARILNSRTVLSPFSVQTTLLFSSWEKVTSKGFSPSNSTVAETVSAAAL